MLPLKLLSPWLSTVQGSIKKHFAPVVLRSFNADDVQSMATWTMDARITPYVLWKPHTSHEAVKKYLTQEVIPHPWYKAILFKGKVVGSATLDVDRVDPKKAELGYVIAFDYWNKGIASGAVQTLLKEGFTDLNVDIIEAKVDPTNVASQKVCERNGMRRIDYVRNAILHEGTWKDRIIYRLESHSWKK
jgi:RimJ/RimL family protein N-acetyltransferase